MDPASSELLDDKDEWKLDDRDEFFSEIQRVFCKDYKESQLVGLRLKSIGYTVTIGRIHKSVPGFVVEGKR